MAVSLEKYTIVAQAAQATCGDEDVLRNLESATRVVTNSLESLINQIKVHVCWASIIMM